MNLSYTLGLTACAALMAVSGIASAAATRFASTGTVVSATDGPGATGACAGFQQVTGAPSNTQLYYPGAGVVGMAEVIAATSPASTTSKSAQTYTCVAGNAAPTFVAGKTTTPINLICYLDTMAGPGTTGLVGLQQSFQVAAAGAAGVKNVSVMNVAITSKFLGTEAEGFPTLCTTVTDATWIKQ